MNKHAEFVELKSPTHYRNSCWVVRPREPDVTRLSDFLHDSLEIYGCLSRTMTIGDVVEYDTTAEFKSCLEAWEAASQYYNKYNMIYPYAIDSEQKIYTLSGEVIDQIRNVVENDWAGSQVMEFE